MTRTPPRTHRPSTTGAVRCVFFCFVVFAPACGSSSDAGDASDASYALDASSASDSGAGVLVDATFDQSSPAFPAACPLSGAKDPSDGYYPTTALPAGACTDEPTCSALVEIPCPCGGGSLYEYTCTCSSALWSCAVTSVSGATCDGCPADASTDAAADSTAANADR